MICMVFDTKDEADKFMRLYETYRKIVFYTVKRFIDNENDIEDYLQDIYIIIGEHLDKIDEEDGKRTRNYLITITRNYCISHWRKAKHIQEEAFLDDVDYAEDEHDPLNIIIGKESYSLIKKALEKLDVKYRAVLELKYINDMGDDSIARVLNIKKKNVQIRIYRAKNLVRAYVKELENG